MGNKKAKELENEFAGLDIKVKSGEFLQVETKKMLRVSARACVGIAKDHYKHNIEDVIHDIEILMDSENVYDGLYALRDKLTTLLPK